MNVSLSLREFRMSNILQVCMFLGELWAYLLKRLRQEVTNKGSHSPVLKALPYYKMYLALRDAWAKGVDSVNCAQYPVISTRTNTESTDKGRWSMRKGYVPVSKQSIFSEGGKCPFINSLGKRHDLFLEIMIWGPEHHRSKSRCSDVVSVCGLLQVKLSPDRIFLQDWNKERMQRTGRFCLVRE